MTICNPCGTVMMKHEPNGGPMDYLAQLKSSCDRHGSIVCLGLDPVIENIPVPGSPGTAIVGFYRDMLNRMIQKKVCPAAVKPNYAFYAQYGFEGIEALVQVIDLFRGEGFPVILDTKRGDIGTTASAYAKESFDFFKADAVTLSPFMGHDSIRPFQDAFPGKGCYILTRTSNKSAFEIQEVLVDGAPLYMHVTKKIIEWYAPGIGSVAGATYPDQLARIAHVFNQSGKEIPFLIPGIGTQGGDLTEVVRILKKSGDVRIHRINSSSGINYAYKTRADLDFPDAAVSALRDLNNEIDGILSRSSVE